MLCCLSVSMFFLVAILGYVLVNGASYINWEFLTALPLPAGETGGGIANALVGSAMVVAVATLMAVSLGVGGAILLDQLSRAQLWGVVSVFSAVFFRVAPVVVVFFS